MKNKYPIQVVLPLIDDISKYEKGIDSVLSQGLTLIVAYPENQDVSEIVTKYQNDNVVFYGVQGDVSRTSLINSVVENKVDEMYFALLDANQFYNESYFETAFEDYINLVEKSVYLNIASEKQNDKLAALSNYRAWDAATHEQINHTLEGLGTLNKSMLTNRFFIVSPCGAIYNSVDFVRLGGFKKNIKMLCENEYILRASVKTEGVYVIPQIGIECIYLEWLKTSNEPVNDLTITKWFNIIKGEYLHEFDRPIDA